MCTKWLSNLQRKTHRGRYWTNERKKGNEGKRNNREKCEVEIGQKKEEGRGEGMQNLTCTILSNLLDIFYFPLHNSAREKEQNNPNYRLLNKPIKPKMIFMKRKQWAHFTAKTWVSLS